MSRAIYVAIGHGDTGLPQGRPDPPPPLIPGAISVAAGNGRATISIAEPPSGGLEVYTYQLYRSTTEGVIGSPVAGATTFPFEDTGLANGTTYHYALEVTDGLYTEVTEQVPATPARIDGGEAPSFGDHEDDELIWQDSFDNGTSAWFTNVGQPVGSGGVDGGPHARCPMSAGGATQYFSRGWNVGPTHIFFEFYVRFPNVKNPGEWKYLIMHHTAEGANITRYQWDSATYPYGGGPEWTNSDTSIPFAASRLTSRWQWNTAKPGPSYDTQPHETQPIFVWDNGGGVFPHKEPAPVWSGDRDIDKVPWDPWDDGAWHKHTFELKLGNDGYCRVWADGFLYLDSSDGPMQWPGLPDGLQFDGSAPNQGHKAFFWDFDAFTVWKRA